MTTAPATTCYRHPDRPTGRRCTRCGRPACPDCLRDASVGAHCVECVKAAQPTATQRFHMVWRTDHMLATKIIVGINVVAFVLIGLKDKNFNGSGPTSAKLALFGPAVHNGDWYRLFTSSVVHYGFLHIAFNMLVLWQVGVLLERGAGHIRFATLYVVSVLAGSAGALIVTPHALVGGASGGVFGIAAAATLVLYRQGVRFWHTGFGPLLVINFILNFTLMSNVSIGGHIGGTIGGVLAAEAMIQARKVEQPMLGYVGAAFIGAASILIAMSVAGT